MWLLDVNMPGRLVFLLKELGIGASTAQAEGWGSFSNGSLVESAVSKNFSCLLTRDRLFGESASHALKRFAVFSVVLVTLPQLREQEFLEAFRMAWTVAPIVPAPGRMTPWP